MSASDHQRKIGKKPRRPWVRAAGALVAGAVIGLGVQYWTRQAEKPAATVPRPAAAVEPAAATATSPSLDIAKTRSAARACFIACAPMIEHGTLKNMPPADVERI